MKLPTIKEPYHLVEQPSLKVLQTFPAYTAEAIRWMSNANACLKMIGIEYFGLYTTAELEQMRQRRQENA